MSGWRDDWWIAMLIVSLFVGVAVWAYRADQAVKRYIEACGGERTGNAHTQTTTVWHRTGDVTWPQTITTVSYEYRCRDGETVWR